MKYSFTSESVSEGHPDKVADQISDAILDAYLEQDAEAKVACECLITTNHLVIAGEAKTTAKHEKSAIDIAKETLQNIGYDHDASGFNHYKANYTYLLHEQSPEINHSVADGGAGDQGLMFGYATNETPEAMPMPISIAHELMATLAGYRKSKQIDWLLPDAKSQVTIGYVNGKPHRVEKVVVSSQHIEGISQETIREVLTQQLILPIVAKHLTGSTPEILINPSGSFTIGGPHGDTGLTGRKIIVDTYGGSCPHGGGAFSGKDPSKVDRSAAYAARYVAKHVVAAGLADKCTVQISYAIGKEDPTSLYVDLQGNVVIENEVLIDRIREAFDLRPNGIIHQLGLKRPIYLPTAAYGHFGKSSLPWEQLNDSIIHFLQS